MQYTVFISLEPYLAQWLQHESGGDYPIRLKRGSAEADILECFLTVQPRHEGYVPQLRPEEGQVEIVLPCFRSKDVRTYNYLPPKAAVRLRDCIRNRFLVMLWKDLYTIGNITRRTDVAISEWMKQHGIVDDDRNWNTIAKILQRKRAVYCADGRLTNRKSSPHRKKVSKIFPTSKGVCPPEFSQV